LHDSVARRLQRLWIVAVTGLLLVTSVRAGQPGRARRGRSGLGGQAAFAVPADFDGGFQFCRIVFRTDRNGDGNGWDVDWPRAEEIFSFRLSELTRIPVVMTRK